MKPTTREDLARINQMFDKTEKLLSRLYDRWLDEHAHEDIAEYAAVVKKSLPSGFEFLSMQKRPFGFTFSIGTDARYAMLVSARRLEWKRVA